MDLKNAEKTKLTVVCPQCGKPVAGKARTNVTRFLFQESRCTCSIFGNPVAGGPSSAVANPVAAIGTSLNDPGTSSGTESIPDPSVGENLGERYQVLAFIGEGGMGKVYKVKDKVLDKIFAVKVLNSALVEDHESLIRFEHEAAAARSLTHPNLAAVYDFGMGALGAPYIVMDYLQGETLQQALKRLGALDVPRSVDAFIQIAAAASYAHAHGVIHRDIKPSNIILTSTGSEIDFVKLLDFGIAKVLPSETTATQNLTETGDIFGSPLYMSPEQCQGNPLDARSDIYALGCVMYETLTGRAPFAAENPVKIILKHCNQAPPAMADTSIPADLEQIVLRCLEKEPDHRYQSMEELCGDLEAFKNGKKLRLPKTTKAAASKPAQTHWAISLLIWLFPLVLLAYFWQTNDHHSSSSGGLFGITHPPAGTRDDYTDAVGFDAQSYYYFNHGMYKQALPLLQFDIETFRQKLTESPHDLKLKGFLADSLQHAGKCYLALKEYDKAEPYYKEALSMYMGFGNYQGGGMNEALIDYESVLRALNRPAAAIGMRQIQLDWRNFYLGHPSATADAPYWTKTNQMIRDYGHYFEKTPTQSP